LQMWPVWKIPLPPEADAISDRVRSCGVGIWVAASFQVFCS
jgi:hypothetical protein